MNKITAAVLSTVLSVAAQADTVTFGYFNEADFVYTNNGSSANLNVVGGASGDAVMFAFDSDVYAKLISPSLQGELAAHLRINNGSGVNTTTAVTSWGSGRNVMYAQAFNQAMTLAFTLDQGYLVTSGSRAGQTLSNLLTVTIAPYQGTTDGVEFAGRSGAASSSFDGDFYSLTYTSDFLDFSGLIAANGGFSFSGITPSLASSGSFLRNFTAQATGNFAADPAPLLSPDVLNPVPEPSSMMLLGVGLITLVATRRRLGKHPRA